MRIPLCIRKALHIILNRQIAVIHCCGIRSRIREIPGIGNCLGVASDFRFNVIEELVLENGENKAEDTGDSCNGIVDLEIPSKVSDLFLLD